jgi:hypothetical protein
MDFSFVFSAPLTCLKKTYFQQAGSYAVEGTSQPVIVSKKSKNPSSA